MTKKLYTLFALLLIASMGLSLVPAVSAHGGGGGDHAGDHSSMPTPPVSMTMPAPTPCGNCQPMATPQPGEHQDHGSCENCGAHPAPMASPVPAPQRNMEQHTVRVEAKVQGVMSRTMSSTMGVMIGAIEEATGMTVEEIMAARAEGESWSEIIADSGASVEDVVAILIEAKAERLQTFVDEGLLSEEFVQQLLDMLALRWTAVLSN